MFIANAAAIRNYPMTRVDNNCAVIDYSNRSSLKSSTNKQSYISNSHFSEPLVSFGVTAVSLRVVTLKSKFSSVWNHSKNVETIGEQQTHSCFLLAWSFLLNTECSEELTAIQIKNTLWKQEPHTIRMRKKVKSRAIFSCINKCVLLKIKIVQFIDGSETILGSNRLLIWITSPRSNKFTAIYWSQFERLVFLMMTTLSIQKINISRLEFMFQFFVHVALSIQTVQTDSAFSVEFFKQI